MGLDEIIHTKTSKKWLVVLVSVSLMLVLVVTALLILLVINKFDVEIRVAGDPSVTLEYGEAFQEPGAAAVLRGSLAFRDGIDLEVKTQGTVEEFTLGTYQISYTASLGPWSGSSSRTVYVVDTTAPVITLFTNDQKLTQPGQDYREEGYLAMDNCDGDITDLVEVTQGDGVVVYTVSDSSGNCATITRQIRYASAE